MDFTLVDEQVAVRDLAEQIFQGRVTVVTRTPAGAIRVSANMNGSIRVR